MGFFSVLQQKLRIKKQTWHKFTAPAPTQVGVIKTVGQGWAIYTSVLYGSKTPVLLPWKMSTFAKTVDWRLILSQQLHNRGHVKRHQLASSLTWTFSKINTAMIGSWKARVDILKQSSTQDEAPILELLPIICHTDQIIHSDNAAAVKHELDQTEASLNCFFLSIRNIKRPNKWTKIK